MRKISMVISLFAVLAFLIPPDSLACGDKLLALSRGIRFQQAYRGFRPASILVYANRNLVTTPLKDPKLHSTLKQAGHSLRMIETSAELELALRSGRYDLILADLADSSELKQRADAAPTKPLVLPVFSKPNKSELKAAEKQYGFYLLGPNKPIESLIAIDLAMKSRPQNGRAS